MSQLDSQDPTTSNGTRTTLLILVAMVVGAVVLFMLYSHLPRASANNGMVSDLVTPTPVMTHPMGTLTVNHSAVVDGVTIMVTQVQQAASFSDDKKQTSPYVVRVGIQTHNGGQEPIGLTFPTRAYLMLPDGQSIALQLVTVSSVMIPKASQVGYLDFPVQRIAVLSGLVLRFDKDTLIPFAASK